MNSDGGGDDKDDDDVDDGDESMIILLYLNKHVNVSVFLEISTPGLKIKPCQVCFCCGLLSGL